MPDNDTLKGSLDDALSYPILTEEVGFPTARPSGAGASGSLGETVEGALREVLAWRPKASDPRGFVAALTQAFDLKEVEGRTLVSWTPRSYAVQHDLGAVTGAQASIYARAKAALEQSLPLLDGLYPLRADNDDEDVGAVRAVVRSELSELVNELGQVGGPRVQRIDTQFVSLLGRDPSDDPEKVAGLFGQLRTTFGLERARVNTILEEENLTNFLIIADHTLALRRTWEVQRHFFDRAGSDVFLGTQLVLLSRALAVVAESAQEVYFAMDSVFLNQAERQTTYLPLGPDQPRLTVAELLSWVERFATEEGPRVIRDAGKSGVIALQATVEKLETLTEAAARGSRQPSANPTRGFHTPRVQRALGELSSNLSAAHRLFGQIRLLPPPEVTLVVPNQGRLGAPVRVDLEGENFDKNVSVRLVKNVVSRGGEPSVKTLPGRRTIVLGNTVLRTTFDLSAESAETGSWRIIAHNPDGSQSRQNVRFEVLPPLTSEPVPPLPPRLTATDTAPSSTSAASAPGLPDLTLGGVSPDEGHPGEALKKVTVQGTGIDRRAQVSFGNFVEVSNLQAYATHAFVSLDIPGTDDLRRELEVHGGELPVDVTVTNPDGRSETLENAFTLRWAAR